MILLLRLAAPEFCEMPPPVAAATCRWPVAFELLLIVAAALFFMFNRLPELLMPPPFTLDSLPVIVLLTCSASRGY